MQFTTANLMRFDGTEKMKIARLVVLGVAVVAGLLAARLVLTSNSEPQQAAQVEETPKEVVTEDVLVAAADVKLGSQLNDEDMKWVAWPKDAVPENVILRSASPDAMADFAGRIAKAPIYGGEPVRAERLIDTDRGFMSAILPKGKRAIALPVEALTTAGGFILPGDKVDLILTKAIGGRDGGSFESETILENVRVLAIDTTTAGEQDDKSLTPGQTATLELAPAQAEIVAQAQQAGVISLALRSAQDSADDEGGAQTVSSGVNFVRFGVSSKEPIRR